MQQQLFKRRKGVFGAGQAAVVGVQCPGGHLRQQCHVQRYAAIATVDGVAVDKTFFAGLLKTVGRELGSPHHHQHLAALEVTQQRATLAVQPLAQVAGLVQHSLRRNAPFVDRHGLVASFALQPVAVPPAALAQQLQVVVRQLAPGVFLVQRQAGVAQTGLQLHEARHLGHDLPCFLVLEGRTHGGECVAEGVVTGQRLHRCPGAAVGRAQHQQARARARHQALPDGGLFQLQGARHHAAHRVHKQPHRLAAVGAGVELSFHLDRQAAGFFFDRAAPVKVKHHHLVALFQVFDQGAVDQADWAVGQHLVAAIGLVAQLVKAAQQAQTQPDAFAIDFQIAAQQAGQHDHTGALAVGFRLRRSTAAQAVGCASGAAHAVGCFAGPGQRPDGPEPSRVALGQAFDHRVHRQGVAKVGEVCGLATLVEHETGAADPRRAAVHRAGVDHDVVVGPVKRIGQQGLDPAADAVALQVTGHHAQVARDAAVGAVEPLHQGAAGHHGFQARDQGRVGAAFGHRVQEVQHFGGHQRARGLEGPGQHRQIRVQPARRQQGATRRAGHAHHPFNLDVLFDDGLEQRVHLLPLALVSVTLEGRQVVGVDAALPGQAGQHLGHQATA